MFHFVFIINSLVNELSKRACRQSFRSFANVFTVGFNLDVFKDD